ILRTAEFNQVIEFGSMNKSRFRFIKPEDAITRDEKRAARCLKHGDPSFTEDALFGTESLDGNLEVGRIGHAEHAPLDRSNPESPRLGLDDMRDVLMDAVQMPQFCPLPRHATLHHRHTVAKSGKHIAGIDSRLVEHQRRKVTGYIRPN